MWIDQYLLPHILLLVSDRIILEMCEDALFAFAVDAVELCHAVMGGRQMKVIDPINVV